MCTRSRPLRLRHGNAPSPPSPSVCVPRPRVTDNTPTREKRRLPKAGRGPQRGGCFEQGGHGGRDGLLPPRWLTVALLPLPRGRSQWGGCVPSACVRDDAQNGEPHCSPHEASPNSETLLGERACVTAGAGQRWALLLSGPTPSGALRQSVSSVEMNSELGSVRRAAGGCPGRPRPAASLFRDQPRPTLLSPARRGIPQPGSASTASPVPCALQPAAR